MQREAQSVEKHPYNEYYARSEGKNIELLRLMKEREKERNALMEKIKQAEHDRSRDLHVKKDERAAKETDKTQPPNGNYYALMNKQSPTKLPLLPDAGLARPTKAPTYEYMRPSWWG